MALRTYFVEQQKLDGVWLVLDGPGGDVVTTRSTQGEATSWVRAHHPHATIRLAHGNGQGKWAG